MLHLFDPFLKTAIYDEPASRLICLCEVFDGLIFLTRNTAIGGGDFVDDGRKSISWY